MGFLLLLGLEGGSGLLLLGFLLGQHLFSGCLGGGPVALGLLIAVAGLVLHDGEGMVGLFSFRGALLHCLGEELLAGPELVPGGGFFRRLGHDRGVACLDEGLPSRLIVSDQAGWIGLDLLGLHGLFLGEGLGVGGVGLGVRRVGDGILGTLLGGGLGVGRGGAGLRCLAALGCCPHHVEALLFGAARASLAHDAKLLAGPLGSLVDAVGGSPHGGGGPLEGRAQPSHIVRSDEGAIGAHGGVRDLA